MDLLPLDVVWVGDELITPPGPKMWVCIDPAEGLFFRINTEPKWQTPIFLKKEGVHEFLAHDSYLECGFPIEADDYALQEYGGSPIGALCCSLIPEIVKVIDAQPLLSPQLRLSIKTALGYAG